jgi:hypothetical protein
MLRKTSLVPFPLKPLCAPPAVVALLRANRMLCRGVKFRVSGARRTLWSQLGDPGGQELRPGPASPSDGGRVGVQQENQHDGGGASFIHYGIGKAPVMERGGILWTGKHRIWRDGHRLRKRMVNGSLMEGACRL